jgi:thiol-disulfide isomerase/thioredoxin
MLAKHAIAACGILTFLVCQALSAQSSDPRPTATKTNVGAPSNAEPSQAAQETQSSEEQSEQPLSVAEAARLARASKGTGTKAAKNYDDDNFPRSSPIAKKNSADVASGHAPAENLLPEMQGKIILLDFWASWCGPCRMALPKVKELQAIYGSDDFVVVSISEDNDVGAWRAFVANHDMSWTQRFDGDSSLMRRYQVNGLPTYVLLDRIGDEIQRYVGEDPGQSILERVGPDLKRALQSKQTASN